LKTQKKKVKQQFQEEELTLWETSCYKMMMAQHNVFKQAYKELLIIPKTKGIITQILG
jgi:hypothetical protein